MDQEILAPLSAGRRPGLVKLYGSLFPHGQARMRREPGRRAVRGSAPSRDGIPQQALSGDRRRYEHSRNMFQRQKETVVTEPSDLIIQRRKLGPGGGAGMGSTHTAGLGKTWISAEFYPAGWCQDRSRQLPMCWDLGNLPFSPWDSHL